MHRDSVTLLGILLFELFMPTAGPFYLAARGVLCCSLWCLSTITEDYSNHSLLGPLFAPRPPACGAKSALCAVCSFLFIYHTFYLVRVTGFASVCCESIVLVSCANPRYASLRCVAYLLGLRPRDVITL